MRKFYCGKCGGTDLFLSKQNIIKGAGWTIRGKMQNMLVCRVCNEIAQTEGLYQRYVNTRQLRDLIIDFLLIFTTMLSLSGAGDYGYLFLVATIPLSLFIFRIRNLF